MSELFNDAGNQANTSQSFLEALVKEKGEQWKDPEVIAKGKLEADNYIKQLKEENDRLKELAAKQDYAKSLLDELQKPKAAEPDPNPQTQPTSELTEEKLKSLVETTISAREQDSIRARNKQEVTTKLLSEWGEKAGEILNVKAAEIGMPVAELEALALRAPQAFFKLVGVGQTSTTKNERTFFGSSVNTEGSQFQSRGERNSQYYSNLRRENRKLYDSPEVQGQRLEDFKRLSAAGKW